MRRCAHDTTRRTHSPAGLTPLRLRTYMCGMQRLGKIFASPTTMYSGAAAAAAALIFGGVLFVDVLFLVFVRPILSGP